MGIRWPKVISNTMVWEATGKKPIILQIRMRNLQGISQTLRTVNEATEKQALIGICKEAEGEEAWKKKRTIFEEARKCGKIWSKGKRLVGNRFRWRCFINAL